MIVGHMFNGGTVSMIRRRQLHSLTSVKTILTTPMPPFHPFNLHTFEPAPRAAGRTRLTVVRCHH